MTREELREKIEAIIVDEGGDGSTWAVSEILTLIDAYTAEREKGAELRGRIASIEDIIKNKALEFQPISEVVLGHLYKMKRDLRILQATEGGVGDE